LCLVFRKLFDEVGSLVLIDEFSNPLHLGGAGSSEGSWISLVWKAEVEMMSRLFNEDGDCLVADLLEDATSMPWVKASIAENDVGCLHEVLLWVNSSEVLECPVVLW